LKLVLASSSDIRQQILSKYNISYITAAHKFDEESYKKDHDLDPIALSMHLATNKSLSLADDYEDIILGCDQVCMMGSEIFSKPLTKIKAIGNLLKLAGNTHKLIGSYAFSRRGKVLYSETITSLMTMKNLSEKDIIDYVELDEPLKSCGSYMFEKNGYNLFSEVTGSLEAINGLPFGYLQTKLMNNV